MQPKDVLDAEQLALARGVVLHAAEVARLDRGLVADPHLLLLVHLSRVYELFKRACAQETVDGDITRLAESVCAVHRLQVVRRIFGFLRSARAGKERQHKISLQLGSTNKYFVSERVEKY